MGDDFRASRRPWDRRHGRPRGTTNTWALADLLGRHAGRVVVSNRAHKAIASAKRKTDDIDAATLAELLAADYLPPVWQPDEATGGCAGWCPTAPGSSTTGRLSATASPRRSRDTSCEPDERRVRRPRTRLAGGAGAAA